MIKITITGPQGSGKQAIVDQVKEKFPDALVVENNDSEFIGCIVTDSGTADVYASDFVRPHCFPATVKRKGWVFDFYAMSQGRPVYRRLLPVVRGIAYQYYIMPPDER